MAIFLRKSYSRAFAARVVKYLVSSLVRFFYLPVLCLIHMGGNNSGTAFNFIWYSPWPVIIE